MFQFGVLMNLINEVEYQFFEHPRETKIFSINQELELRFIAKPDCQSTVTSQENILLYFLIIIYWDVPLDWTRFRHCIESNVVASSLTE